MKEKICLLDDKRLCSDCGECDRCDLDPEKICDNCCRCLEETTTDYAEIKIDAVIDEETAEENDI